MTKTNHSNYDSLNSVLSTNEPPTLGPERRSGAWEAAEVERRVADLLAQAGISGPRADLIRSLALLWHDHLEASHHVSQSIAGADGSFVHGMMHRREPDFGNAAYWYRKVGDHPMFPELAAAVAELKPESVFTSRLVQDGRWNPFAMIDACEAVQVGSADEGDDSFLREVQSLEFHLLLKYFCDA